MHTLSDDELTLLFLSHVELLALAERYNVSLRYRSILSIVNAIIKAKKKQEKKN